MSTSARSTPAVRWTRDARTLWRAAPDDLVVVLGPDAELPISLRGTGALIWTELEHPATVTELATRLARRFGADADLVRTDVDAVVATLADSGALRPDP